jgi:hypothetical protein
MLKTKERIKVHNFQLFGEDVLITSSRRIDEAGFTKACEFIRKAGKEILSMKKSSIIILHDYRLHSFVIERMNTDTFTLHVQYEIKSNNVYEI